MTEKPATFQAGRLALREEGQCWNAYYAMPHTMVDALFLGSIRMGIIRNHPRRKAQFMALMREAVGDILKEATGSGPVSWDERAAPDDELGNA
jgi:hypothetical protein